MYNIIVDLDNDEIVQFDAHEVTIEYNEKRINISIMITNKRMIFLQDINKNTIVEALNITGKFCTLPTFEAIEEISKKEIKDCCYIENGTEIITNDKSIFVFHYDLTEFLCK